MKIDPYLSPCTKPKSKWIKGLNINLTTLNLLEEKVGSSFQCMNTGDHFLNKTINKWDLLKLRSFFKTKDTVNKTKRKPTEWEKSLDKGLISKIYKELNKLDIKILNNPIKLNYGIPN